MIFFAAQHPSEQSLENNFVIGVDGKGGMGHLKNGSVVFTWIFDWDAHNKSINMINN